VKECATGAIDGSNGVGVELDNIGVKGGVIIGVEVGKTAPAPSDAHDLVALVRYPIHHRLYAGVEAGDVAPAGQDSNAHR
jgi:hypothetical protein